MNQKKSLIFPVICMILLSGFTSFFAVTVHGDDLPDYFVAGFVFVNGEPTDGVEVILSVPSQEDRSNISYYNEIYGLHGMYKIAFYANQGQYASFTVKIDGEYYTPVPSSLLLDQSHPYFYVDVNLSVVIDENNPPSKPTTPSPQHNSGNIDTDTTLSVYVYDPDGDHMDVTFYDDGDNYIGRDYNVPSGTRASVSWLGLDYNTVYSWYAVADDKKGGTNTSDTWTFTTKPAPGINHPPNKPAIIIPENNSEDVILSPALSVYVTDPDDDPMNVSFYNASDDSLLGTVTNVANGSMVFIVWYNLDYNTTYHWYAVANDSEFETRSDTWTFTTVCQVKSPVINITTPVGGLYFGKLHLFPDLPFTVILGSINITANAIDDVGIERVEFYIDDETEPRYTDYEAPYNWTWDEKVFLKHEIKVIAYDEDGLTDTDAVEVFIFNLDVI